MSKDITTIIPVSLSHADIAWFTHIAKRHGAPLSVVLSSVLAEVANDDRKIEGANSAD